MSDPKVTEATPIKTDSPKRHLFAIQDVYISSLDTQHARNGKPTCDGVTLGERTKGVPNASTKIWNWASSARIWLRGFCCRAASAPEGGLRDPFLQLYWCLLCVRPIACVIELTVTWSIAGCGVRRQVHQDPRNSPTAASGHRNILNDRMTLEDRSSAFVKTETGVFVRPGHQVFVTRPGHHCPDRFLSGLPLVTVSGLGD